MQVCPLCLVKNIEARFECATLFYCAAIVPRSLFNYQNFIIMKTNDLFNLANARVSLKNAKTPCAIVKSLYVFAEEKEGKDLKAILPAKKQDAIDLIATICEMYNVGGTRKVTIKGVEREFTIKFSADMFLRGICKLHNTDIEAAIKVEKAEKREAEKKAREEKRAAEKAEKEAAKVEKKAA